MFGYDWAAGFVTPFASSEGTSYTTPPDVVEKLLDEIKRDGPEPSRMLVDCGSGDGRLVLAAARRGMTAHGVELDPELVAASASAAAAAGLSCTFECASLLEVSLPSDADVVAYLLPAALQKLAARLLTIGHKGRLFAIRWSIQELDDGYDDGAIHLAQRVLLAESWPLSQYTFGSRRGGSRPDGRRIGIRDEASHRLPPRKPSQPRMPAVVPSPAPGWSDLDEDGSAEWQNLPVDLFGDANLVSATAESYSLDLGHQRGAVRVEPRRATFERREPCADPSAAGTRGTCAAGIGADHGRMTGALQWDASIVLASYLIQHSDWVARLAAAGGRCVELGAGLGLVGLTAAGLGLPALLTDRCECLPLLQQGVELNARVVSGRASTAALEWGDATAARALRGRTPFQLVLLSDCVYQAESVPMLIATLCELLAPPVRTESVAESVAEGMVAADTCSTDDADGAGEHRTPSGHGCSAGARDGAVRDSGQGGGDGGGIILFAQDAQIDRQGAVDAFRARAASAFMWVDLDASADADELARALPGGSDACACATATGKRSTRPGGTEDRAHACPVGAAPPPAPLLKNTVTLALLTLRRP